MGSFHPSGKTGIEVGIGWILTQARFIERWRKHITGWWLSHPSEKYESQLG